MSTDDHENWSPSGERMNGGTGAEALTRVELDVAYSSEKLLNLEILLMQVADRVNDFEAVDMEYEDISDESVMKAFESDVLSGILNMEVKDLQGFMPFLQIEIMEAHQNLSHGEHLEQSAAKVEEKLHDAEESVKKLQDSMVDLQKQSSQLERTIALFQNETRSDESEELENGHLSSTNTKWKLQTVDQQRHVLQMLEKSLARELDLEKKLSDSRSNEDDLKLKLHYAERELYCMEESIEICLERAHEAENAAELLLGISKELAGKIQVVQLNLNGSLHREDEMRSKLEECMAKIHAEEAEKERLITTCAELDKLSSKEKELRAIITEAEDKSMQASSEISSLKEKVRILEVQLRESDVQLQLARASVETSQQQQNVLQSELSQMENIIEGLKANVLRTENRAESAESMCTELSKTNVELNEELVFLRHSEYEKTSEDESMQVSSEISPLKEKVRTLEEQLRESDIQLQGCMAKIHAEEAEKERLITTCAELDKLSSKEKVLKAIITEAEDKSMQACSEISSLKVRTLEEQLRESDVQLQLARAFVKTSQQQQNELQSELSRMENTIEALKADALRTESRAESAEAKCTELSKTNIELNKELVFIRNSESEKTKVLERRCKESDSQLEHAKASVEALEEQKNGLYVAIADMQNIIEGLKGKVSKAENRAVSIDTKCTLLTKTNLELNEELSFLRGRLEYLEASSRHAEGEKITTAKDIGIRTKVISDLVMKLALERERLQLQMSALTTKNKILVEKCKEKDNAHIFQSQSYKETHSSFPKSSVEALTESSTTDFQVEALAAATPVNEKSVDTVSVEESSGADSRVETVRIIEAAQLDPRYFFMACLVLFIAVLTFYVYQQESNHT